MTILFQGTGQIPQGDFTSPVFNVPSNIKQPGIPVKFRITFDSQPFPSGLTTISIGVSFDNGATYRFGGMGFGPGVLFKGSFAPWVMEYSLGANDNPTHAKYMTNAPSAFNVTGMIEAL